MKSKQVLSATKIVFWASFIFWIAETHYFGWNATSQSRHETICDNIVNIGVIGSLLVRIEVVCHYVISNFIKRDWQ